MGKPKKVRGVRYKAPQSSRGTNSFSKLMILVCVAAVIVAAALYLS